jgi:urease gamma subunit
MAKTDERVHLQDRRARELLAMTYEIFAELRQLRNREGIKYMYSELFRSVADKVLNDYEKLRDSKEDPKAAAALLREYKNIMKEAAVIDGAYDTSKVPDDQKKKPTKIVIKRKTVINNGKVEKDELTEEANYELSS